MSTFDPNAVVGRIGLGPSQLHQQPSSADDEPQAYPDYTHTTVTDRLLNDASLVVSLFKSVSTKIPHAGPLSEVLGVIQTLMGVVRQMRDSRDDCNYLIERILRFLQNLLQEFEWSNTPIENGTRTALRLFNLLWCVVPDRSLTKYLIQCCLVSQYHQGYQR